VPCWARCSAIRPAAMSKSFRDARRAIAALLSVVMMAGCLPPTTTVPREEFAAASRQAAEYRIETTRGETYIAGRFSVTESTLAIERISLSDKAHKTTTLPVVIALEDVALVQRINPTTPGWVWVLSVAAFIGVVALVSSGDAFTDE